MKVCKGCHSPNLVPRGKYFRNECHACYARTQRESWERNRPARLATSKANYAKHAEKRRKESAERKAGNREYYTLAEWFRRKGISVSHIPPADLSALVDMKRAVTNAKKHTSRNQVSL